MSCWPREDVVSLSDVTSNRTFSALFLPTLPNPGVLFHAPGGAGVCIGKVFPLCIGSGVDKTSLVFVGRVFDLARPERAGAGVCIHAPGGLGVFVIVKLLDMTGVDCSDPSERGGSGRSGISGMSTGGEGVLSIIFEALDTSRGGVTRERAGSWTMIGGESASGGPFLGEPFGGDLPLANGSEASRSGDSSFKPGTRGEDCSGNDPGRGVILIGVFMGDSSSLSKRDESLIILKDVKTLYALWRASSESKSAGGNKV